jgi:hypothetical protein
MKRLSRILGLDFFFGLTVCVAAMSSSSVALRPSVASMRRRARFAAVALSDASSRLGDLVRIASCTRSGSVATFAAALTLGISAPTPSALNRLITGSARMISLTVFSLCPHRSLQ